MVRFSPLTCFAGLLALIAAGSQPSVAETTKTVTTTTVAPAPPAEQDLWSGAKIIAGREAPGYVAFTFDDGPNIETTPKILDTLEQFEVPATFFVVGRHFAKKTDTAKAGAELLRQMEQRGFTIGNHTSNHQHLPSLGAKEARVAVEKNGADLAKVLGHPVHLFRPPFGATNGPVRRMLKHTRATTVRWNIDSRDFRRADRAGIADRVLGDILEKGGGVVLLHDTKAWTAKALPGLLDRLESANCQRLENSLGPIIPVSLHYFLRDQDGTPRRIPPKVLKRTQRMVDRLTERCQTAIDKG